MSTLRTYPNNPAFRLIIPIDRKAGVLSPGTWVECWTRTNNSLGIIVAMTEDEISVLWSKVPQTPNRSSDIVAFGRQLHNMIAASIKLAASASKAKSELSTTSRILKQYVATKTVSHPRHQAHPLRYRCVDRQPRTHGVPPRGRPIVWHRHCREQRRL